MPLAVLRAPLRRMLIALVLLGSPAASVAQESQLEGLNVTMSLVKRTDRTPGAWPAEAIQLAVERTKIKEGETIHALLRARGILPDVEAFTVVYALNPDLQSLSPLPAEMELKLPMAQGGDTLQAALRQDYLVALTVDQKLKRDFSENVKKLATLTDRVTRLNVIRFTSAGARTESFQALRNINDTLAFMSQLLARRNGRPITNEALSQLNAQMELLSALLELFLSSGRKLQAAEEQSIRAVAEDVAIKKRAFVQVAAGEPPARYPEVKVEVKTLKEGKDVPDLRVYYVPKNLKVDRTYWRSFDRKSSPADRWLPEAAYYVWAARDPDPTPVTNEHLLEALKNAEGKIVVELTVIK
jgi:hypothetical protein